jgi:hypothetical protein
MTFRPFQVAAQDLSLDFLILFWKINYYATICLKTVHIISLGFIGKPHKWCALCPHKTGLLVNAIMVNLWVPTLPIMQSINIFIISTSHNISASFSRRIILEFHLPPFFVWGPQNIFCCPVTLFKCGSGTDSQTTKKVDTFLPCDPSRISSTFEV